MSGGESVSSFSDHPTSVGDSWFVKRKSIMVVNELKNICCTWISSLLIDNDYPCRCSTTVVKCVTSKPFKHFALWQDHY